MDLREYAQAFDEAERDFESAVESYGVAFESVETAAREQRESTARSCGCHCENGSSSLWSNWISPACLACRTGDETATFFVDLRCTKSCYFCFNPNQDGYEYFLSHTRDIVAELEQAHAAGAEFRHLAITGGEPLLHKRQVLDFLKRASVLYPGVHTRLYTSGDLLDGEGLRDLAESGLTEIRFSIKPFDLDHGRTGVYGLMEQAVRSIPDVMVEMPVIPGSLSQMKELLVRSDAIGIRGINLLEFCFPLHNASEFKKRGFALRRRPFKYLYNYWYGGGVPVAGSEGEALELLRFAQLEDLKLGVHYCSSDNKNTGQIYQQNKAFFADEALRNAHPWMRQDEGDRFLKCVKAFGEDALKAKTWADTTGSVGYGYEPDIPSIAFSAEDAASLKRACPSVALGESVNVVEERASSLTPESERMGARPDLRLREVAVVPYSVTCPNVMTE